MSRVLLGDGDLSTFAFEDGVYVRISNTCGRPDGEMGTKLTIHEAKQLHKQLGEEIKTAETQEER